MIFTGILQTSEYNYFQIVSPDSNEVLASNIPWVSISRALHGDRVESIDKITWNLSSRSEHPILAGTIELTSKYKYGMTSRGSPIYRFVPFSSRYPPFTVGCSTRDVSKNQLALIRFETWESLQTLPRGILFKTLGHCGDAEAEKSALLWYRAPVAYTSKECKEAIEAIEAVKELQSFPFEMRQMAPTATFHIDPPGCKDIDDALSLEIISNDSYRLWIIISDVAEYILEGSSLDKKAYQISQTTYQNGVVVRPMLPAQLSEGVYSLLPGEQRLGIACIVRFSSNSIEGFEFEPVQLCVRDSYTYDTAMTQIDPMIKSGLTTFAKLMNAETPEDSHSWVESAMIYYNTKTAELLRRSGKGILRKHSGVNRERFAFYEAVCPAMSKFATSSAEPCLATDSDPMHIGLAVPIYCQATSPLRRYTDLINQRCLKGVGSIATYDILRHLKSREKSVKAYERDSFFLSQILAGVSYSSEIVCTVLHVKQKNTLIVVKLWCEDWNRPLTWKTHGTIQEVESGSGLHVSPTSAIETMLSPGDTIRLTWFANLHQPRWESRFVFQLIDT